MRAAGLRGKLFGAWRRRCEGHGRVPVVVLQSAPSLHLNAEDGKTQSKRDKRRASSSQGFVVVERWCACTARVGRERVFPPTQIEKGEEIEKSVV